MPTAKERRPERTSAAENLKAARAIGATRRALIGGFMTELRDLAKGLGMDYERMVKSCWEGNGKTDMYLAEAYLNLMARKLAELPLPIEHKNGTLPRRVLSAASLLLRIHFLDGHSVKAAETANRFNIPERLPPEMDAAYLLNLKARRGSIAERLEQTALTVVRSPSGKLVFIIDERSPPSNYEKMLRRIP